MLPVVSDARSIGLPHQFISVTFLAPIASANKAKACNPCTMKEGFITPTANEIRGSESFRNKLGVIAYGHVRKYPNRADLVISRKVQDRETKQWKEYYANQFLFAIPVSLDMPDSEAKALRTAFYHKLVGLLMEQVREESEINKFNYSIPINIVYMGELLGLAKKPLVHRWLPQEIFPWAVNHAVDFPTVLANPDDDSARKIMEYFCGQSTPEFFQQMKPHYEATMRSLGTFTGNEPQEGNDDALYEVST